MDEKLIAQNIKEEIFRKEYERYFRILEEGGNKFLLTTTARVKTNL